MSGFIFFSSGHKGRDREQEITAVLPLPGCRDACTLLSLTLLSWQNLSNQKAKAKSRPLAKHCLKKKQIRKRISRWERRKSALQEWPSGPQCTLRPELGAKAATQWKSKESKSSVSTLQQRGGERWVSRPWEQENKLILLWIAALPKLFLWTMDGGEAPPRPPRCPRLVWAHNLTVLSN